MKGKIFKVCIVLMLVLAMTMTNFVFVGSSLISYAFDDISTNNKNVEFGVYFKDDNGGQVSSIEKNVYSEDIKLGIHLKVKQQGYFNGKIELQNSNFTLKETQNDYINKIEGNTITLNQINAGSEVELEIPIEIKREEAFNVGLLNMESTVKLNGIYRDSSQKDKEVESSKKVTLKVIPENKTPENIEKTAKIITNKNLQVAGQEKRVIQVLLNAGLKDNSYPIKEININANVPEMNETQAEASAVVTLNTMTSSQYNYENKQLNVNLKNDASQENIVTWKKDGSESIVLTYLYDANNVQDITVNGNIEITLYNDEKIETSIDDLVINKDDPKEEVVTANIENSESTIYKGKLYQGIDREYTTTDVVNVNAANILSYIEIKEQDVFASQTDYEKNVPLQGTNANTLYRKTTINKDQLIKVLGENGSLTVTNANGEQVAVITKDSQADENGNIVIDYGEAMQAGIVIRTTAPITGGEIVITNNKVIKANDEKIVKSAIDFNTALFVTTNLNEGQQTPKNLVKTKLEETVTEAYLEVNKNDLSTVVENDVEIKAVLKSKSELNDLYKNPVLKIQFPEEIEQITINNISMLYEDELNIKRAYLSGNELTIEIQGEQTHYSESAVEGTTIIINGKLRLNRKTATKDTQIVMSYSNEKAKAYANDAKATKDIKIVAPTDVTTVTTIEQLGIEEVNQDSTKEVMLERGTKAKKITPKIEIINNKPNAIKDIKVLGTFPTGTTEESIGINLTSPINVEDATVYYTENENATDDLSNEENGWSKTIQNPASVKKYLIAKDEVNSQESIEATYNAVIPGNLEYNENASQDYQVNYVDTATNAGSIVKATQVKLTTGVGPKLKVDVSATVGNDKINSGDEVKAGEVIKYKVEVSNIGTEVANNITISAPVPENTKYVEGREVEEYTGASYYEEIEKDKVEKTVDKIEVGKSEIIEYEVRVNNDIADGKEIINISTAKFNDVVTESNEFRTVLKSGNMRVSLRKINHENVTLLEGGTVKYYVLVENTSNAKAKDVKIKTQLSDGMKVLDDTVRIDMGFDEDLSDSENRTYEDLDYKEEMNIGDFEPGEKKLLYYLVCTNKPGEIKFSTIVKQGNNEYRSNVYKDNVKYTKVDISIASNQEKYLKSGDSLEYEIVIKNTSDIAMKSIYVRDEIPSLLKVESITVDEEEKEDAIEEQKVSIGFDMEVGEQKIIKIKTNVRSTEDMKEATTITNKAIAEYMGEEIATTQELTHIIQPEEQENPNNGGNSGNNQNSGIYIISGIAWYDENNNGKKDETEKTISGIKANLLNTETNQLVKDTSGRTMETTTDGSGTYIFSGIKTGKYIVIFNYDTTAYSLTKYKVEGADEAINSNAMMNDLQIEGSNKKVASTDIIQINNSNVSDINIGLIKLRNFDLKLDKYVSKIVVQNNKGTTTTQYNDAKMAKAEIHSKQINGSTVLIEYKIRITNAGEIDGYVKKIADYIPNDLKFKSELNKDWYQKDSALYNSSLANEKIAAGESKEVTLTLIKTMTENNTGLVNNTAEIAEAYNELGILDSNSTPGNKTQGENDMSSADVIISIKTGEIIFYTTIIAVITIVILSAITVPIVRKVKKNKKTNKLDKI